MSVDVPEPVIELGVNVPLVRPGSPLTLSWTLELNPPAGTTVTVKLPEPGDPTVSGFGDRVIVNVPTGLTTRVAAAVFVVDPSTPVIVKG